MNYSTDLQVAQDLEQLSNIVNEAIERPTKVLAELRETKAQASDEVSKLLQEVQDTRVQLEEVKAQASELLKEVQDTRVQLQEAKAQANDEASKLLKEVQDTRVQLQEAKAQAIAVQSLELYLQEFQRHHQPHQLRHLLWKELGFVGIVVYFISLITRRK
jgi:uncharacterized coiled-coil DUF342 family protein